MDLTCAEALHLLGFSSDSQGLLPPGDAIRRAFRRQALLWHPDKHASNSTFRRQATSTPHSQCVTNDLEADRPTPPSQNVEPHDAGPGTADADSVAATDAPEGLQEPSYRTQAQVAEHFKLLVSAYQVLLKAAASSAGAKCEGVRTGGDSCFEASGSGSAVPGKSEEEQLLDELSAELLLLEAYKLRLSDFDMVFLHQHANGGTGAVSNVWPEAVRSIDDVWQRIRRRVERRRKKREGAGSGHESYGTGFSRRAELAVHAKWALLSEFLADTLGAPGKPQRRAESHFSGHSPVDGAIWAEVGGRSAQNGDSEGHPQRQQQDWGTAPGCVLATASASAAASTSAAASAMPHRQCGRLPAGFYWRWLKRLVAARLLFFVFFNG
ncbi:hypothetical protein Vretimale_15216 [Volvox reticuliferus]|uniref:J domain-containing protein n=1 Tax=Volvox reticuliferus TaxID=1737510 RepID=A0A8J4GQD5_9CHLO|nr:hypothetical protein Vretifemale_5408 [Volvox reticuliferus]GIM11746.1 hypothetical protein Vretimale_15216 [Volvox reticuliferus]